MNEKITSPEISKERGFLIGGNYYLSIIIKQNITELCFPLCKNNSLFCFKVYDFLNENLIREKGWLKNYYENENLKLIIPPYRYGIFVKFSELNISKIEAYSKIFWEIGAEVNTLNTSWSKYPIFYSKIGNNLPAISLLEHNNGIYVSIGDTPDNALLNGIHLSRLGENELEKETKGYFKKFLNYEKSKLVFDNIMMSLFLSNGICIDSEENCILASKSPKYYVSSAYWARDFIFWTLPVLEKFDKNRSKALIETILKKYWKNKGIHALYMDGRILYDGFELDQFAYYFMLIEKAMKYKIIDYANALKYGEELLSILEKKKSKKNYLYKTELNSSDDPVKYEFVTFDNVVLWYSLKLFSKFIKNSPLKEKFDKIILNIKNDIMDNLIKNGMFVYSSDLNGHFEFYDDPTGSLLLLPYFGFISKNSKIYRNTFKWINSLKNPYFINGKYSGEGNRHVMHPWLHYFSNLLLLGYEDGKIFEKMPMDNKLLCETIDENTGDCLTGIHFPGSSGFFAYSYLKKHRIRKT